MPTSKDFSVEDEAYLAAIAAEPKMTMDEVGADIETHGHVPVTPETATKSPSDDSTKDALYHALDGSITADRDFNDDIPFTRDQRNDQDARLSDPTDDFRDETKGEVEGTTDTPQNLLRKFPSNKVNGDLDEDLKPTVQQDSAVQVKDSLAEALDAIAMDTIEGDHPTENKEMMEKYSEENASVVPQKVPDVPESLGGDKYKTDGNGLCYITAVFTVDPTKYISPNYRPAQQSGNIKNAAKIKKGKAKLQGMPMGGGVEGGGGFTESAKEQARESAMEPDEPTAKEEQAAAKEADKQQEIVEEKIEDKGNEQVEETKVEKVEKKAEDEAPEKVVLDYATFIDGSSFMCFDEIADIDYTKIAMDAGPKKKVTRENCETTFDQCRAQNPLFCRFHGPKLLEKDIKTAIKGACGPGCTVSVTRDKGANKFTFRLTVGCPPAKRDMVQKIVDMYMTQQPGITSAQTEMKKIEEKGGVEALTQEFEMDILKADEPPKKDKTDNLASVAIDLTKEYKDAGKKMPVVKETPNKIVKAANAAEQGEVEGGVQEQGGKGEEVDNAAEVAEIEKTEPITPKEDEIGDKGSEVPPDNPSNTPKPNPTGNAESTPDDESWKIDEELDWKQSVSEAAQKQFAKNPPVDDEAEFDKLVNEAENKGLFENNDFQKAYEGIFFDGKTDMAAKVAAMKALMEKTQGQGTSGGDTKPAKGKGSKGTGGAKVLPAPSSVAKKKGNEEPTPKAEQPTEQPSATTSSGEGSQGDSASEQDSTKSHFAEMKTALGDIKSTFESSFTPYSYEAQKALDDAEYFAKKAQAELDSMDTYKKGIAELENSDESETDKAISKKIFTEAMDKAEQSAINLMEQMQDAMNSAKEKMDAMKKNQEDEEKGYMADSVEKTLKGVSETIFPDGPKDGVDSVNDMANSYIDDAEAAVKKLVGEEKGDELAKSYGLPDLVGSVVTVSASLDVAVDLFKEAMDDGGMSGIKSAKENVETWAGSMAIAFNNLKFACEAVKKEAEELAKLNKAKERLAKGKASGGESSSEAKSGGSSSGGTYDPVKGVTADDIRDFFDEDFDESDEGEKNALQLWLDMANKGVYGMGTANDYFESMGGWLQQKMAKKGINHPVTQAFHHWGLNYPKGMESGTSSEPVNNEDSTEDWSSEIHNPTPEFNKKLKEVVTQALGKDNVFGFSGPPSYSSYFDELTITLSKKQPEGYDYEVFGEKAPSKEELDSLKKNLNEVLGSHGLKVMSSKSYKNKGKNVYFDVIAAPKPKSEPKSEQPDFSSSVADALKGTPYAGAKLVSKNGSFIGDYVSIAETKKGDYQLVAIKKDDGSIGFGVTNADGGFLSGKKDLGLAIKSFEEDYGGSAKKIEPFDFAAWEKEEKKKQAGKSGAQPPTPKKKAQPTAQPQSEEPVQQAPSKPKSKYTDEEKKAKIAAMTPKQKLEAAVKIFKKKLAANPNDETAKAKLAKYEAMLSKLLKK